MTDQTPTTLSAYTDLLSIYLSDLPEGRYHRRDDQPCTLFRDGDAVCTLSPESPASSGLVAALVVLLNVRGRQHGVVEEEPAKPSWRYTAQFYPHLPPLNLTADCYCNFMQSHRLLHHKTIVGVAKDGKVTDYNLKNFSPGMLEGVLLDREYMEFIDVETGEWVALRLPERVLVRGSERIERGFHPGNSARPIALQREREAASALAADQLAIPGDQ